MNDPILYVRPAAQEKSRFREVWLLVAPALVIVIALCHLIACWNSPQPRPWDSRPHRTIQLIRAKRAVSASTREARSEPVLESDDEPGFDPATLPEAWPYGAGWR
jgi:4-amino-4-deoxy-L-arabinose transferase-like glycosyltransferase